MRLDLHATGNTLLSANVQYLSRKYDSFVYFAPNQGLPPNTTCAATPTTQNASGSVISVYQVDGSGKRSFNSPRWSFNLNGQQTVPLGPLKLVLQGGTRYRDTSYITADYLPYLRAKANFVSNASITLAKANDRMFVSLYVFNIENSQRLTMTNVNSAGLVAGAAEQPRTYGILVDAKF